MPNTTSPLSATASATAQTNTGGENRLINATSVDGAAPQFKIPVNAQVIQSVESVDLDLVLTTTSGEKIILQQGALQAATQPESKIVFLGGDSITAADQVKKLGILKPVEGGSFRLKSGDASPAVAEKITGDAFGLGKELQDTMSQLTETSKQLEKVLQTLSTASLTNATDESRNTSSGPSTGTGVQKITPQSENKFASPSPGTPPQPEVEKFTSNNTDTGSVSNIKITSTLRGLYGAQENVISNVLAVDKIQSKEQGKEVLKGLSQTALREMLPDDPLQVHVTGTDPVALQPGGLAVNTLVMPGVLNASSIRFELPQGTVLPAGFQISGQTFSGSSMTIAVKSLTDLSLAIQWTVADLGTTINKTDFQLGVKYLDNKGVELEQGRAPLTFTYGELKNIEDTVQLDGNSNAKIFLSAYGYSYKILGDNSNNNVVAGSGNDTLDGGAGTDVMAGGAGHDTYVVDNTGDVVIEAANAGTDLVKASVSYTLSANVENLTLTGSDNLSGTGNALGNTITGNSGNNTLDGGAGTDTMIGGAGNDIYIVDNTGDVVREESGAESGTDLIKASVTYTLSAHVENLELTGTDNLNGTGNGLDNTITGNSGNNALDGGVGADTMIGGAGNDTYIVDNTGDVVSEVSGPESGTDLIKASVTYTLSSNVENLELTGIDNLNGTGNGLANNITGNSGNNRLDGGEGADSMSGGAGNDTYVVDNTGDVITEALNAGTDTVEASVNHALSDNVENLTLTGPGHLNGTGNTLANTLTGNSGNNTLDGGAGADTMIGGAGNDTYIVDNAGDVVREESGAEFGTDLIKASVTYTLSSNVENLELTGTNNLNGTGNTLNNTLTGNSGNNRLNGGEGADSMSGGAGNDTYVVDNTGDVITEALNAGTDTVEASVNHALSDNVENLTLTGPGHLNGTGNTLANTLTGNSGNNTLDGGAGADTMIGGAGNDTYIVDNTGDVVTEALNGDNDTVEAFVNNHILSANVDNLILKGNATQGTGNDLANTITANNLGNTLNGGAGNDTLIGGDGNDILNGGINADSMSGGKGNDTYIVDWSGDVVTESENAGTDTIEASVTYTLSANVENLTLTGTTAINGTGNGLDNIILGNSVDNILAGGGGNDTLNGGAGIDTASFVGTTAAVIATLGLDGLNGSASGDGSDVLISIENLVGGNGNDTLNGNEQANRLEGATGADTLNGGAGNDTASYTGSDAGITISLGNGSAIGTASGGHAQGDVLSNIENLIGSSSHGDTLTGNSGVNRIEGGGGNDTLEGGGGADTLVGGADNDTYVIHNTGVTIIEIANQGTDLVQSSIDFTLGEHLENLQLMGTANLNGTGNTVNNTITGNAGNNILDGGDNNDTLNGGAGNDSLNGGTGNDSLTGNAGNDTLIGGAGDDTLDLRTDNTTLVGDRAEGGDGADTVIISQSALGVSGSNLDGGAGTDVLRFFGSTGAQLDLKALNAKNFETLDLRSDTAPNKVLISSEGIMNLVNNTSGADVLTLLMGKNDSYTIESEGNVTVTQGQNLSFYNSGTLIAQVNFEYA